jgi:hypothetical protein
MTLKENSLKFLPHLNKLRKVKKKLESMLNTFRRSLKPKWLNVKASYLGSSTWKICPKCWNLLELKVQ